MNENKSTQKDKSEILISENQEPIAIVGMSGRYPQASNLDQYWDNLVHARNSIREIPGSRWDVNKYYDPRISQKGKVYCKWLGLLEDIDKFDPIFFQISPREAELMDPQHRMFLQEGYKSFEDAGYNRSLLSNKKCGVYLGIMSNEYGKMLYQKHIGETDITGNSQAIAAARIAYYLNLKGPAIPVDTACSSSLVATHLACQALKYREIDLALVGGVSVYLTPEFYIGMCAAGMLTPDGKCKPFDNSANGFVPGEGVGGLVLKRLQDAESENDSIYGVIIGSGINQDGKTNGITSPNVNSQIELVRDVYDTYKIDPENISYVEMHGTGTKLGDPFELEALSTVFHERTKKKKYCAIGSVKSNIGHTSAAAGVASIHKILLSIRHKKLVPTLHVKKPNEHFDFENSPFYVNTKLLPWKPVLGVPLRAGVSSFGFSGTNAHVIIEEYTPKNQRRSQSFNAQNPAIILLSAKSEESLKEYVRQLVDFISLPYKSELQSSINLADLSYTLQIGREAMEDRLILLVVSISELEEKLKSFLEGKDDIEGVYRGNVRLGRRGNNALLIETLTEGEAWEDFIRMMIQNRELDKLTQLWSLGIDIDWALLQQNTNAMRIPLPTYPFAKEQYWIPEDSRQLRDGNVRMLHPLVHINTSTLSEQRFSSTFTGEEFFLKDHLVKGNKVLPGVAYLEMVRAAVAHATDVNVENNITTIQIKNVVWAKPLVVGSDPQEIHISLFPESDGQDGLIAYEVYTEGENAEEPIVHSQGIVTFNTSDKITSLNIYDLKARIKQNDLSAEHCYESFKKMGIDYGPAHQGIKEMYRGDGEVLAKLSLSVSVAETGTSFILHPGLLDSALQASIGLSKESSPLKLYLPFALESLEILGSCTSQMYAWVRYSGCSAPSDRVQTIDIDLCDEQGNVCVKIRGVSSRVLEGEVGVSKVKDSIGTLLATPVWRERVKLSSATRQPYAEHQVLLCGMPGIKAKELQSLIPESNCINLKSNQDQIETRFTEYAVRCFEMIRELLEKKPQGKVLIQILVPNTREQSLFAGLSGLLKTAALENPKIVGQIIQVDPREKREELARKLQENQNTPYDAIIRYEGGKRRVLTWEEHKETGVRHEVVFKDRGVYLITGGLGGLGVLFTREILSQSKDAKIILTGRSRLSPQRQSVLDELQALGGEVEYQEVDVSNLEQVNTLIESIQGRYGKLCGIIHSAGVILDNFILKKTSEEFRKVLLPKVTGTVNLDRATQGIALDFFVLFSSGSGAMGNIGQADYATANAFMDRFAAYRNELVDSKERQGQTLSINWPLWGEGGMGVDAASEVMMKQSAGMIAM
ncbi:MAG: SDR family NAD(P)-dependent oxidoreductase [Planctomycetes bacterium]|nr:SDR family NAD(P)-dependent oxidoreductase [Planctomycetota bacterium]